MRSVFFCPVYDEIERFPELLEELRDPARACDEVLLVNNGSSDGCERLIHESGLPFIDVDRNQGLGYACIVAADWAIHNRFDIFGIIAGNGKMLPSEMPKLLDPILGGECDCVTGSRFLPGGTSPNLPRFRKRAIPGVTKWISRLAGFQLTDATCGYRAFRLEPLTRADFDWHASWLWEYGFEFYVYSKYLQESDLRCKEVPITMRYPTDGMDYTKVQPVTGWWSMLRPWIVAHFDNKGFARTAGND